MQSNTNIIQRNVTDIEMYPSLEYLQHCFIYLNYDKVNSLHAMSATVTRSNKMGEHIL